MIIVGIDPGLTGAVAFLDPEAQGMVAVHDMPVVNGHTDAVALAALLRELGPTAAVVERVSAMPKQGVASTFNFGESFGICQAAVLALGIRLDLVSPRRWKTAFGLTADKEQARSKAIHYWPSEGVFARKKDHGRAEAALLALYGARVIHGFGPSRAGMATPGVPQRDAGLFPGKATKTIGVPA